MLKYIVFLKVNKEKEIKVIKISSKKRRTFEKRKTMKNRKNDDSRLKNLCDILPQINGCLNFVDCICQCLKKGLH
jgi:hypothetical protein